MVGVEKHTMKENDKPKRKWIRKQNGRLILFNCIRISKWEMVFLGMLVFIGIYIYIASTLEISD